MLSRLLLLRGPPKKPIFGFGRGKKKAAAKVFGGPKKNWGVEKQMAADHHNEAAPKKKRKKKQRFSAWAPKNTTLGRLRSKGLRFFGAPKK